MKNVNNKNGGTKKTSASDFRQCCQLLLINVKHPKNEFSCKINKNKPKRRSVEKIVCRPHITMPFTGLVLFLASPLRGSARKLTRPANHCIVILGLQYTIIKRVKQ